MSERKNSSSGPYCICRSSDDKRFMICCDKCNEWFHGDCVRIRSDESKKILHFYCPPCRDRNVELRIIYRSTTNEHGSSKLLSNSSSSIGSSSKGQNFNENIASPGGQEKRRGSFGDSQSSSKPSSLEPLPKKQKLTLPSLDQSRCGNCIGCFRKENCGRCDVCKTNGGGNSICLLRRCVMGGATPPTKSFRSDDSEEDDYTDRKKRQSATTSIRPSKLKNVTPSSYASRKELDRKAGRPSKSSNAAGAKSSSPSQGGTRANARAYRNFLKDAGVISNSEDEGDGRRRGGAARVSKKPRQCQGPQCVYAARTESKYCSDECGVKLAQIRVHRYFPSRLDSFYGRRPIAEEYEQKRLEKIKADNTLGNARLVELDNQESELASWSSKCKSVRSKENESGGKGSSKSSKMKKEPVDEDSEMSIYCVTCGNETSMKNAIKHFAKCFSKYESQTSYGSSFKAVNNIYSIFCDTYNKANRTYCKRLRVICPEHAREEKIEPQELCGFPFDGAVQTTKGGGGGTTSATPAEFDPAKVCTSLRKNCIRHYRWMQIRRALIDMERLSQLLRLEELSEEQRCIQMAQNSRGAFLALLLHETTPAKMEDAGGLASGKDGGGTTEKTSTGDRETVDNGPDASGAGGAEDGRVDKIEVKDEKKEGDEDESKFTAIRESEEKTANRNLEEGWQAQSNESQSACNSWWDSNFPPSKI